MDDGDQQGLGPHVTLPPHPSPTSMGSLRYQEDFEEEKNSGVCPGSGQGGEGDPMQRAQCGLLSGYTCPRS